MTTWAFVGAPSGGEILLILVVILLLFGTKNLPQMARTLGRTLEQFRRAAREVTDEIMHGDAEPPDPPRKPLLGAVPQAADEEVPKAVTDASSSIADPDPDPEAPPKSNPDTRASSEDPS